MAVLSYQWNSYSCGIHAIQNAARILSVDSDYDDIKRIAGTSRAEGTSCKGIICAIEHLALTSTVYRTKSEDNAWKWLLKWSQTCPVIVLVDGYLTVGNSHWATVIGRTGDRVILSDPSANAQNGENGVHVLDKSQMLARWKRRICYAIRVSK